MSTPDIGPRAHDPELLDRLAALPQTHFSGEVWRATRLNQDPSAFSYNGGRWAPPSSYQSVPVLYTSLTREGAIAEMTSWLQLLVPRPNKPILVHHLHVSANLVVALDMTALGLLGVDVATFPERNYVAMFDEPPSRTQEIGAALSFLGVDGLIVPSARSNAHNLILFDNANNQVSVETIDAEEVDWVASL